MNEEDLLNVIKESESLGSLEQLVLIIQPKLYESIKDLVDNAYCFYKVIPSNSLPKDTQAIMMNKENYERLFELEVK